MLRKLVSCLISTSNQVVDVKEKSVIPFSQEPGS